MNTCMYTAMKKKINKPLHETPRRHVFSINAIHVRNCIPLAWAGLSNGRQTPPPTTEWRNSKLISIQHKLLPSAYKTTRIPEFELRQVQRVAQEISKSTGRIKYLCIKAKYRVSLYLKNVLVLKLGIVHKEYKFFLI